MTEEQFLKFWEDAIDHLKLQRSAVWLCVPTISLSIYYKPSKAY